MEDRERINNFLETVSTSVLIGTLKSRNLTQEEKTALGLLLQEAENATISEVKKETKKAQTIVERFAEAVVRSNVHGKLPKETKIKGAEINPSRSGWFFDHGPDSIPLSKQDEAVSWLYSNDYGSICTMKEKLPHLVNSHIASVFPSKENPGNMVLTVYFFQDKKAPDSRNKYTPAHVQVEFPKKIMTELLNELPINPDLLEELYQEVFTGLDSKGDEFPGMRRAKADGLYLITEADLEKINEMEGRHHGDLRHYGYPEEEIRSFFENLERYKYRSGPYGSGDAFEPK